MTIPCVVLLGGSFDPVHQGHVALAQHFCALLAPDQLRIIPAGQPWQKDGLQASAQDRVAMLRCAFDTSSSALAIDQQEIQRHTATYTIDTLQAIRAELGPQTSMVFLIGADQLQHLDSWRHWRQLFDYAHICAASRPGFALDSAELPAAVAHEFAQRAAPADRIRNTACGSTYLAADLAVDVSATAIRAALRHGDKPAALVPSRVLDYIESHHLYQN